MKYEVDGRVVEISKVGENAFLIDGVAYSRQEMPDGRWKVIREVSEGQSEEHVVHVTVDDGCDVHFRGHQLSYDVVDQRSKVLAMATGGGSNVLKTQMPGRLLSVLVEVGQEVSNGDVLVVMEAMKMENQMKASADGVVKNVLVQEGDLVDAKAVLVELG